MATAEEAAALAAAAAAAAATVAAADPHARSGQGEEEAEQQREQAASKPAGTRGPPPPTLSAAELAAHERSEDGAVVVRARAGDGRFPCPFCERHYKMARTLRRHLREDHRGHEPKCHVMAKEGRAVGMVGEAKTEHVRRLNREANQRYHARMRAQQGPSTTSFQMQQYLPIPPPPTGPAAAAAALVSIHLHSPPPPPSPHAASSLAQALSGGSPSRAGGRKRGPPTPPTTRTTGGGGSLPLSPLGEQDGPPSPSSHEQQRKRARGAGSGEEEGEEEGMGMGGNGADEARRAAFGDMLGLSMQDHPDDASAERAKCLEAFVLLWSKEPQVFAAVEEHLREHPLPEGLGAVEGMEPAARLQRMERFLQAVAAVLPQPPPPPPPESESESSSDSSDSDDEAEGDEEGEGAAAPSPAASGFLDGGADVDGTGGVMFAVPLGAPPSLDGGGGIEEGMI